MKKEERDLASKRKEGGRVKTEKIVMLTAAVMLLTALTATGVYLRGNSGTKEEIKIDLTKSGEDITKKADEITKEIQKNTGNEEADATKEEEITAREVSDKGTAKNSSALTQDSMKKDFVTENPLNEDAVTEISMEDDLDYDPAYLTEEVTLEDTFPQKKTGDTESDLEAQLREVDTNAEADLQRAAVSENQEETELHFGKETGFALPVNGRVIMNYNMKATVYHETLDQYKYQPGLVIEAKEGTPVSANVKAKVTAVENSPVYGTCVHLALGDDYELIYGQLGEVSVKDGQMVERDTVLGKIAQPTKYYAKEGTNLYVQMNRNGEPVNPMTLER